MEEEIVITEESTNYFILYYLYLGKLKEFGLIEGGSTEITGKGFDIAIDLYDAGVRIPDDYLKQIVESDPEITELKDAVYKFMSEMQQVGFEVYKEYIKWATDQRKSEQQVSTPPTVNHNSIKKPWWRFW